MRNPGGRKRRNQHFTVQALENEWLIRTKSPQLQGDLLGGRLSFVVFS